MKTLGVITLSWMTHGVIKYAVSMVRWTPGTQARLRSSAVELFDTQGFSATTVAQIVDHAGVTRRTFFRYFSDKREVLFGDDELPRLATQLLQRVSMKLGPLQAVIDGLQLLARERFEPQREAMLVVSRIIKSEPSLIERDLRKQFELRTAIANGLESRGAEPIVARMTATIGVEIAQHSLEIWLSEAVPQPLSEIIGRHREAVHFIVAQDDHSTTQLSPSK